MNDEIKLLMTEFVKAIILQNTIKDEQFMKRIIAAIYNAIQDEINYKEVIKNK